MTPYSRQHVTPEDIERVVEVLKSDYLTQGPMVPQFENALSNCGQATYAIAVNSATSALHLACLALGLGEGDIAWTTPITFAASANCILYCGATVDFVDIEESTFNMSTDKLAEKLQAAQALGRLPKVVIPVHLCGTSCDMEKIFKLSQQYGFKIIEDASHAIGGRYQDQAIGNCKYSDITVFSFHAVKIVTTGEGGALLTNNEALAARMRLLRSHGITRDLDQMTKAPDGPWYYQQLELGYNYRMTDIQAALGVSQLTRLTAIVNRRNELAFRYDQLLADANVLSQFVSSECWSARHLYVIRIPVEERKGQIFEALRSAGYGVNVHYIPVHCHPHYQNLGFTENEFPSAVAYYRAAISLPLFPELLESDQDRVVDLIKRGLLN